MPKIMLVFFRYRPGLRSSPDRALCWPSLKFFALITYVPVLVCVRVLVLMQDINQLTKFESHVHLSNFAKVDKSYSLSAYLIFCSMLIVNLIVLLSFFSMFVLGN